MSEEGAQPPKPIKKIPDDEPKYRWLRPDPIYCDSYTAQLMSGSKVVRISFGEYISREYSPIYRISVVMPIDDIKALRRTLARIIKEAEEEDEDASGE